MVAVSEEKNQNSGVDLLIMIFFLELEFFIVGKQKEMHQAICISYMKENTEYPSISCDNLTVWIIFVSYSDS